MGGGWMMIRGDGFEGGEGGILSKHNSIFSFRLQDAVTSKEGPESIQVKYKKTPL